MPDKSSYSASNPPPIEEIFRQLEHGAGREWVNDDNAKELIKMAALRGNKLIETELIEWLNPLARTPDRLAGSIIHDARR